MGINKSETLTIAIAQAGLRQLIVKAGSHQTDGIGVVESKRAHAVQVLFNLSDTKRAFRQSNLVNLMQPA